ncbi:hypothetical protein AB0H28_13245 [Micromonospora sp. NPDC050980]|uniref:hypothetical protein n=1 Tax=Micromonospora sp. NPDC050980 TaxID=3155161 RepID=UPI0033D23509
MLAKFKTRLKARKAELFGSLLDGGDFASAQLTAADIRDLHEKHLVATLTPDATIEPGVSIFVFGPVV